MTFLGTGTSQGVPVIACTCPVCLSRDPKDQRLRSSILVETQGKKLVIDCGPDFRQQMLRENVNSIDAILITHGHKDHIGGLDDVRAFNYFLQRPTDVFATKEAQVTIKNEFSYAFADKLYPGVPEIRLTTILNRKFTAAGIPVQPIKATHYNDQFVFGYRIENFTYLTDANKISSAEKKKMLGSEIIVINALRKKKHYSHFNLEEAVSLLKELQPQKGFLTHISHQMGLDEEIKNELPDFVELAYDGQQISL